jgi:hypothetical protein
MAQAAGAIAAAAGPVSSMVGGLMQARADLKVAKDQSESLNFQADQMDMAANDTLVDLERERVAVMGAQRASYGASGVKVNVGSPMMVLAETDYRADVQRSRITRVAEAESALVRTNAKAIHKAGTQAYTGSLIGLAGKAISMAGSFMGGPSGGASVIPKPGGG